MAVFQITLPYAHNQDDLRRAVTRLAGGAVPFRIVRRSIDARQHRAIRVEYAVTTDTGDPSEAVRRRIAERRRALAAELAGRVHPRCVVVGSGPGGLFCALWLAEHGIAPVLLEQGPPLRRRLVDMAGFMKTGDLRPYSNICFGAGGAGTYSDGKLMTRIRSPHIAFVMDTFVRHGAPEEIRYLANPHLGSNRIRRCIDGLLEHLRAGGAELRFDTRLTDLHAAGGRITDVDSAGTDGTTERRDAVDALFLATGHSSRATYALLRARGVAMDAKEFAVGLRVEHSADVINAAQYGERYRELYPGIETASYRAAHTWKDENRAVFSFCMCPGGYVLNASTETDGVVTNGMSNAGCSGRYSNAAIVANVSRADLEREGYGGTDGAMEFQRELERRFCRSVNAEGRCATLPAQRLGDFLSGRRSGSLPPGSCMSSVAPAPLHELLPRFVTDALTRGFGVFDRKVRGFASFPSAQLFGIESRTSSPYRVHRDPGRCASPTFANLYPIGEGAGFAGGITSAAVDGIRCAEAWIDTLIGPADA